MTASWHVAKLLTVCRMPEVDHQNKVLPIYAFLILPYFGGTQNNIFWKYFSVFCPYITSQLAPMLSFMAFKTFFFSVKAIGIHNNTWLLRKAFSEYLLCSAEEQKSWNDMSVSKWWQNVLLGLNYPYLMKIRDCYFQFLNVFLLCLFLFLIVKRLHRNTIAIFEKDLCLHYAVLRGNR